jgi:hypothetical protein
VTALGGAPALVVVLVSATGCGRPKPAPAPRAEDPDRTACVRLCTTEGRCAGAQAPVVADGDCQARCAEDVARMKPGFVQRFVACFAPAFEATCRDDPDRARTAAHDRCFDETIAAVPADPENKRAIDEAFCGRFSRCQGLGEIGRVTCLGMVEGPTEPEEILARRVLDAVRRERALALARCLEVAPCDDDDAVSRCHAQTLGDGEPKERR